jgi:cyclopropane fatty-acyl-phospholipid synthase-like methyltransferase
LDKDWYQTFFRGVALDLWRKVVSEEHTRAEVDFLVRELALEPGAAVLDVPCGLGRHSLELASRGFRATGVDLSEEAIEEARGLSREKGLAVDWRHSDMREVAGRYDAAFCFGNSFAYIEPAASRQFIRAVSASLAPGARFALETGIAAESILPNPREREWHEVDDILFLEENRYLVEESCVETVYTFVRNGTRERRVGLQWIYTVREIRSLLEEEGLTTLHCYGSLQRDAYALRSPILIVIAQKK